jgi:hypothetical protein
MSKVYQLATIFKNNISRLYFTINKYGIINYILVSFYIFIIAPLGIFNTPDLSIDGSWMLALPAAVEKGMTFGSDFLFTYGPLGFLVTRIPLHHNKLYYIVVDIYFLSNVAYLLYYILKRNSNLITYAIIYVVCITFGYLYNANLVLTLTWILVFMLFLFIKHNQKAVLINSILLTLFLFFTKVNVGIIVIGFLYSCLAFCVYLKRITLKEMTVYLSVHLLATILLSYFLRVDLYRYIIGSLHLIDAYNDAMFMQIANPVNLYFAIFIIAVFVIISVKYFKAIKQDLFLLYVFLLVASMLYIVFKQGFVRADGHYLGFFIYSTPFISLVLLFCTIDKLRQALTKLVVFTLFLGYVNSIGEITPLYYFGAIDLKVQLLGSYIANASNKEYQFDYTFLKPQQEIPEHISKKIGNSTVDIIPTDISYIILNNLNYNPRPVIQTYSAYDAYLDNINFEKYNSADAPEYIIFTLESIDNRYAFYDETKTKLAILKNYEVIDRSWKYLLLRKLRRPGTIETVKRTKGTAKINEYFSVSKTTDLQYLKPDIEYSLLGKLKRFFHQPPQLSVSFILSNGEIKTFKAIKTVVNAGVIINKYVEGNTQMDLFISHNGVSNRRIKEVKFHTDTPWGFKKDFTYTNELIKIHSETKNQIDNIASIRQQNINLISETNNLVGDLAAMFEDDENYFSAAGWAAIEGMGTENSTVSLILQSDKQAYICQTIPSLRHEVTENHNTSSNNKTGYYTFVSKKDMAPGKYRLGVQVIKNDTLTAIEFTDKLVYKEYYQGPILVNSLPPETNNLVGDLLGLYDENDNYISIGGWAAIEGMGAENTVISIVLQSDKHSYVCQTVATDRPDVTAHFNTFNFDKSGYHAAISKKDLAPGKYKLGIRIVKKNTIIALQFTDQIIEKSL